MGTLKAAEIRKMSEHERKKRLEELRIEMIRARVDASKKGSSKIKEIKKTVARILTIENAGRKK